MMLAMLFWYSGATAGQARRALVLTPPVVPACISSPFGPRVLPDEPRAGTYHYGVDLPAPVGASVLAVADGMLIRVQDQGPGGLEILVQHQGFVGVYSHLKMINPVFAQGKTDIGQGEMLGLVGTTGVTSGPHVYFEMIMAGTPVDPEPYLGVTACGAVMHRQAVQKTDELTGTVIGGRKYYEIILPLRQ
jgi:murein DD-endopeptidase MepM/ murein hydrolase activator NlpD